MTATPHNGKEEDFQLFLALLDGDRFEGRFRDGVHQVEVSDLMRRIRRVWSASFLAGVKRAISAMISVLPPKWSLRAVLPVRNARCCQSAASRNSWPT
jgi:hypothetical protein